MVARIVSWVESRCGILWCMRCTARLAEEEEEEVEEAAAAEEEEAPEPTADASGAERPPGDCCVPGDCVRRVSVRLASGVASALTCAERPSSARTVGAAPANRSVS